MTCLICKKEIKKGKFCSMKCMGKGRIGNQWKKGYKFGVEFKQKMSTLKKGKNSNLWKGGVSKEEDIIRHSLEYRLWREAVLKRDNFCCVLCGYSEDPNNLKLIQTDHIKPFASFPELRFAINNGRTLCKPCHLKTDTWGGRKC